MEQLKSRRSFFRSVVAATFTIGAVACNAQASTDTDRMALEKTFASIRAGFAAGDVESVMTYHHPQVRKALSFDKVLVGRDAVAADLGSVFREFHIEFVEDQLESLLIEGDTAIEQSLFTIKGTPLHGQAPFLISGRSMVVYVRYSASPTGWASIREIVQPSTR
jgi:ketosteroid isomerase-like protein